MAQTDMLSISPEVAQALAAGQAVVALDPSAMTALEVEDVVRRHGAVPATIAIIQGRPCIGLSHAQLEHIARRGPAVHKVSRRDLALVVSKGLDGATTVSATMLLAALAGIRVFVTGGVGGVHRGAETTMDISADLTEFARSPVAVVCAGAKSVLDIPKTLEFLETQGVCVAAYQTDEFPAFFTPHSGCRAPCRVDSAQEVARMIATSRSLGLSSGMVLAVPIPREAAAEGEAIEHATSQALAEASQRGIKGSEITPFLLERIRELTGGKSLEANIKLVKNNATIGAAVAVALAGLQSLGAPTASKL